MFRSIKSIHRVIVFMCSDMGRYYTQQFLYVLIVKVIAFLHLSLIALNMVAMGFLVGTQPWYIFVPMITLMISPVIGGTHCLFNRLENIFRMKALMPLIDDRMAEFLSRSK